MPEQTVADPATTYDLSNCDREPIHILGTVQDYGCLIAVSADWVVTHASTNCADLLGYGTDKLIGYRLLDILPQDSVHYLRTRMQVLSYQFGAARIFAYPLFGDDWHYDIAISQSDQHLMLEFEPRQGPAQMRDHSTSVQALITRVKRKTTTESMTKEAARGLKILSGFDRVMVYRFNEDQSGTVIAEDAAPGQEPFLGLRYPASDIPKQARALATKSLLRIIADIDAPVHPILPAPQPGEDPLDQSLTITRAVSPIHLEYLRNMGVQATLTVSILRDGALWGLFACHHRSARFIDYETRSAVELFAQLFNYALAEIEMKSELAEFDAAQTLHDQMMSQLSGGKTIRDVFDLFGEEINAVIPHDGAAIYSDGVWTGFGSTLSEEELTGLARFLSKAPAGQVYATDHLAAHYANAEVFADRVAGLLALPISRAPRDYLVLFRKEVAKTVTWAGDPEKPVTLGPHGARLTPRASFAAWQEVVRGQSTPWRKAELRAADALRVTLLEVVLKLADERNELRKAAQNQQELLIAELNHRVRNILNLIRGLVAQGDENAAIDAYRNVLDARIYALARAHDQLTRTEWSWVSLRDLLMTEIQAYQLGSFRPLHITGEEIALSPQAFTTLALVFHELVTNAAKYGALKDAKGSIFVDVTQKENGAARIFWRERGGPPVQAPQRRGFGTTIIERSIPYELGGSVDIAYLITGLEVSITLPAAYVLQVAANDPPPTTAPTAPAAEIRLSGPCLVLEDNIVIALDSSDMLEALGASKVSTAARSDDALRLLQEQDFAFALLDVNLGDETSFAVAERCAALGVPAILATGYGSDTALLERFPPMPVLKKPFTRATLQNALADLGLSPPGEPP